MFECKGPINISPEKNKIPHKTLEEIAFEIFFEERRWLHANPTIYTSKEYKELMKNYIIETDKLKESSKNFFDKIVKGDKKYIFLAGKRGIGKTTFLNYFLNTRTKKSKNYDNCNNEDIETLNDKNLTWIRIDATKIYRQVFQKSMTFEKYLYGQILYVYFRYKDGCKIIKVNENNNEEITLNCCEPDKIFKVINLADIIKTSAYDSDLKDNLIKYIEKVEKECQNQPNFEDGFDNKPDSDCNSSIREEKYNCILAKLLLENLKDKLILFIDGVDNLDYSTFMRKNSIKNLVNFIAENNKYFKKIIISARYDTIYQIKKEISSKKYGEINTFLFELNIGLDYIEYFKNRIEQIKNYQCNDDNLDNKIKNLITNIGIEIKKNNKEEDFYYKNECYNKIKKNNIETVICFLNKKQKLLDNFDSYLGFYKNVINQEFKIDIKELFNDDFREIIVNVTKCFFYLRMDYHNRLKFNKENSFEKYLQNLRTRNVLKNAIIKNGNLYGINFDEISYIPPYRNIAFTNMFNIFGIKNAGTNYEFIIYFLVLKIMHDKEINSITKLQDVFKNYKKDTIEGIVAKFMEYGYIVWEEDKIALSKKGEFFVKKFFSNMFFLHSNIYNGLLREEFIDFISPHETDFSDYISKTIENVSVLLYDLYLQLKDIKIYIDDKEEKIDFKNLIRNSELISHFKGLIKQRDNYRDNYTFSTIFENLKKTYNKNKGNNDCNEKCNKIINNIKNFLIITMYGETTFSDIEKEKKYANLKPVQKIKLLIDLLPLSYENIKDSITYMKFIYGEDFLEKRKKQFENDFQEAQNEDVTHLLENNRNKN